MLQASLSRLINMANEPGISPVERDYRLSLVERFKRRNGLSDEDENFEYAPSPIVKHGPPKKRRKPVFVKQERDAKKGIEFSPPPPLRTIGG